MKKMAFSLPILLISVLLVGPTARAAETTTIVTNLSGARGSDYLLSRNQSFFVERYAGSIWRVNMNGLGAAVLGTGYNEPMDIALSADNVRAYVIENGSGGTLLRLRLAAANRANATVVSTNIGGTSGHILTQLALDEAHNCAYVVQNSGSGAIWRINLTDGSKVAVATNIVAHFGSAPGGLLLNKDATVAYFTTLGATGKVFRLGLSSGTGEEVVGGLTNPSYLDWANSNESAILVAHAGRVSSINITEAPASLNAILTGLNNNTRSVRRISDDHWVVCVHGTAYDVNLSSYTAAGPMLLGIGHVPFDRIVGGYADTTGDAGIPLQVKDAPFGGTLDVMINHDRAFAAPSNARYYKLLVDGEEPKQSWSDYLWDAVLNRFVVKAVYPDSGGFYPVRTPTALWYEHWLGYRLNTSGLTNAFHTITLRFYKKDKATVAGVANLRVRIDNRWPTATISKILHDGVEVPACAMVADGSDEFTFRITAHDPDGHLASWSLYALWGDNQSDPVASDSYSAHLPGPSWPGITNTNVPAGAWTAVETCCAHTFHLSVWDRTIDGHNYLHWSGYNKSITIMTGCAGRGK
jgi:hypothetical protein